MQNTIFISITIMKQQTGKRSRYSNSLRAGRSRVRILAWTRYYICSKNRPDRLWGPPGLLTMGFFRGRGGGKRPGRDIYDSPTIADVMNLWSYTSTPHTPLSLTMRNFEFKPTYCWNCRKCSTKSASWI